jgi:hypothetical protein
MIEIVRCPEGPNTDSETGQECETMAHGSAFIYRIDGKERLITARHNVTGRHWHTNEFIGRFSTSPTHLKVMLFKDPPDKWKFSLSEDNPRSANLQVLLQVRLVPLIDQNWEPIWRQHSTLGGDVDVAEVPFNPPDDVMIMSWERTPPITAPDQAPWPPQVLPGEDVFIVGYPYGLTVGPAMPLWIRGTVASDPMFGYEPAGKHYPAWLIDARTRQGQSGAPVMRIRPEGSLLKRNDGQFGRASHAESQLLGVYSGRTSKESDLGFVWSIDEVDEICRNGVVGDTG